MPAVRIPRLADLCRSPDAPPATAPDAPPATAPATARSTAGPEDEPDLPLAAVRVGSAA